MIGLGLIGDSRKKNGASDLDAPSCSLLLFVDLIDDGFPLDELRDILGGNLHQPATGIDGCPGNVWRDEAVFGGE